MRILILGGDGMLGHQLFKSYKQQHDVRVTLRKDLADYNAFCLFNSQNSYTGIDVRNFSSLIEVFSDFHPEAVINSVGIVKQRIESKNEILSLEINALLPHRLHVLCKATGTRLVQISTDCVFSGERGNYIESDESDAKDLYGKTKYLGELYGNDCLTLRTSIIGLELARCKSLVEWFLDQNGIVKGYTKAVYSGFTTIELARIIENLLIHHTDLSGLWHVASQPISKYELLMMLSSKIGRRDVKIEADSSQVCDRSLDASRFNNAVRYNPPTWDELLTELAEQIKTRK